LFYFLFQVLELLAGTGSCQEAAFTLGMSCVSVDNRMEAYRCIQQRIQKMLATPAAAESPEMPAQEDTQTEILEEPDPIADSSSTQQPTLLGSATAPTSAPSICTVCRQEITTNPRSCALCQQPLHNECNLYTHPDEAQATACCSEVCDELLAPTSD
jgi:hypothetical protein